MMREMRRTNTPERRRRPETDSKKEPRRGEVGGRRGRREREKGKGEEWWKRRALAGRRGRGKGGGEGERKRQGGREEIGSEGKVVGGEYQYLLPLNEPFSCQFLFPSFLSVLPLFPVAVKGAHATTCERCPRQHFFTCLSRD